MMRILILGEGDPFYRRMCKYLQLKEVSDEVELIAEPTQEVLEGAELFIVSISDLKEGLIDLLSRCRKRPELVIVYERDDQVEAAEMQLNRLSRWDQLYAKLQSAAAMRRIINEKRCRHEAEMASGDCSHSAGGHMSKGGRQQTLWLIDGWNTEALRQLFEAPALCGASGVEHRLIVILREQAHAALLEAGIVDPTRARRFSDVIRALKSNRMNLDFRLDRAISRTPIGNLLLPTEQLADYSSLSDEDYGRLERMLSDRDRHRIRFVLSDLSFPARHPRVVHASDRFLLIGVDGARSSVVSETARRLECAGISASMVDAAPTMEAAITAISAYEAKAVSHA